MKISKVSSFIQKFFYTQLIINLTAKFEIVDARCIKNMRRKQSPKADTMYYIASVKRICIHDGYILRHMGGEPSCVIDVREKYRIVDGSRCFRTNQRIIRYVSSLATPFRRRDVVSRRDRAAPRVCIVA